MKGFSCFAVFLFNGVWGICVCMCVLYVFVSVHTCTRHICEYLYVEAGGQCPVSFLDPAPPLFPETGWPASFRVLPASDTHHQKRLLYGFWGSELRSSCLHANTLLSEQTPCLLFIVLLSSSGWSVTMQPSLDQTPASTSQVPQCRPVPPWPGRIEF